jgi:hypothetical protein
MKERSRSPWEFRLVVAAGIGLVLLTGAGAYWIKANAERPQTTIEMAIGDGTLPIAYSFDANAAVAELLQSLPPDLALDVCANLSGTVARTAQRPCDELREITAIAPAASSGLPQSAMGGTLAALAAEPALPPQAAPTSTAIEASSPQLSPIQTPLPQFQPPTAAMEAPTNADPSDAPPSGVAASGAQIASAQTTEAPLVAAADDRDSEAKLLLERDEPATTVAPTIADGTTPSWLPSARGSALETSDAADLDEGLTGEARAKLAAAAAAAKAKAQAKAKAIAAAKAKAKAKARARAARNDAAAPASVGRGKDRDNGASGSGESGDSDGGHQ